MRQIDVESGMCHGMSLSVEPRLLGNAPRCIRHRTRVYYDFIHTRTPGFNNRFLDAIYIKLDRLELQVYNRFHSRGNQPRYRIRLFFGI